PAPFNPKVSATIGDAMRAHLLRLTMLFILAVVIQPLAARADITRFDLSGTIRDNTGGVLPGVTVTLKNVDTGFARTIVTDSDGRYTFNAVPPTGKWRLSAELQGFQTQVRDGLEFQAN